MMEQARTTSRAAGPERSWEDDISRLTTVGLSWTLPFEIGSAAGKRSKQTLRFCDSIGEPVQKAEFGAITPAEGIRMEVNDPRRVADIEFALAAESLPLFRERRVLRAHGRIRHDSSAWRLRQSSMIGFPRNGCFAYDLLPSGVFVSPRSRLSGRRFVIRNAGSKDRPISVESNQDWLIAEPSKFLLPAEKSTDIRLRLITKELPAGEHSATVRVRCQQEVIKALAHVTVGSAPAPAVLQPAEMELPVAGMADSVQIAIGFTVPDNGMVEGAIVDAVHRLRKTFRGAAEDGRAQFVITLPTSELIKSIHNTWLLRVYIHSASNVFPQVLRVRLMRQLIFEPSMPVLSPGETINVRVKRCDGARIKLRVEQSPGELEMRATDHGLEITMRRRVARPGSLRWTQIRDEISGERAMLPTLL